MKQTLNKLLFTLAIIIIGGSMMPQVAKAQFPISLNNGGYTLGLDLIVNISSDDPNHTGTQDKPFVPGDTIYMYSNLRCYDGGSYTIYPSCIIQNPAAKLGLKIKGGWDYSLIKDLGNLYANNVPNNSVYEQTVTYTIPSYFTNKDTNGRYSAEYIPNLQAIGGNGVIFSTGSTDFHIAPTFYISAPVAVSTTVTIPPPTNIKKVKIVVTDVNNNNVEILQDSQKRTTPAIYPKKLVNISYDPQNFKFPITCIIPPHLLITEEHPEGEMIPETTKTFTTQPSLIERNFNVNPDSETTYKVSCSDTEKTTVVTTDSFTPNNGAHPYATVCGTVVNSFEPLSERGIVYRSGDTPNPTISDNKTSTGNAIGQTCTGGIGNNTGPWHARAYAIGQSGAITYGNDVGFWLSF